MDTVIAGLLGLRSGASRDSSSELRSERPTLRSAEAQAKKLLLEPGKAAQTRAAGLQAKDEAARMRRETEEDLKHRREEVGRLERRITETEADLRERGQRMDAQCGAEERTAHVRPGAAREGHRPTQDAAQADRGDDLPRRGQLASQVIDEAKRGAMAQVPRPSSAPARARSEPARSSIAIQRVASEQTAESSVSVFTLPSEDMKGRIIGREDSNIRAFEAATGVNIIIDDTPEAVVLSCFDPVRREAARMTLEKLVQDGIQPARIEEVHELRARPRGADPEVGRGRGGRGGLTDVHPELIKLWGGSSTAPATARTC